MPGYYIDNLKHWAAEQRAAALAERAYKERPLEDKILDWYAALPPQQRRAYYTMDDLVLLFNAAPSRIGMALHRLGWLRRRCWHGDGSYARFWVPAQVS